MQTQTTNDQQSALAFAKALCEINGASKKNQVEAIRSNVDSDKKQIKDYINFPSQDAASKDIDKFKAQIGKYIMYVACGFASRELGKHRLGSNKGVRQNFRHFSDEKFAKDLEKLVYEPCCGCKTVNANYNFFNVSKICWSRGRKEAMSINSRLSELGRSVVKYCNNNCSSEQEIKETTQNILKQAMDCCKCISEGCNKMYCKGLDFVPGYGWINPSWRLTMGHGGRYLKKGVDRLFGKMGVKCCTWNSFSHDQSKYDNAFKSLSDAAKPQQTELK